MGADGVGIAARLARAALACALFAAAALPAVAPAAPRPARDSLAGIAAEAAEDANTPTDGTAKSYRILLTRPMKVGQRYAYSADATVVHSANGNMSGASRAFKSRSASVHFDGEMEVLAVNVFGEPTKVRFTVNECNARSLKDRITVFDRGTVVIAEAGRYKTKLSPDRGGLTIDEDVLARAVLSLPRVDGTTEDHLFGTQQRQKVGAAWPVNREQIVKSWLARGARVRKENVSGSVRLKGVERIDGVACLRINGRAVINDFAAGPEEVPDGVRVKAARSEIKFTRLSPIDLSKYNLVDSYSLTTHLTLETDESAISPDVSIEGKSLHSVGVTLRLLDDDLESVAAP